MISRVSRALAALLMTLAVAMPLAGQAMTEGVFRGRVVHITANNIKVRSASGETLGFVLVPHFGKIFHSDGKTTVDQKLIHVGDRVSVYYDQKALGIRHADRIIDADAPMRPLKS